MPNLFRPTVTRHHTPDGRRCTSTTPGAVATTKKCKKWWAKYTDDHGTTHRVPLSTNKAAALRMLADLTDHGGDPYRRWAAVPLDGPDGHLAAFADHRRAAGLTEGQVRSVGGQLARVAAGCGWRRLADLDAGQAAQWLRREMRDGEPGACPPGDWFDTAAIARLVGTARAGDDVAARMRRLGFPPARDGRRLNYPRAAVEAFLLHQARGMAPATRNRYVASLKAFGAWLAGPGKRMRPGTSPFADLGKLNEEADLRHDRRALAAPEVGRLLDAVRASPRVVRGLTGEDRYHLYLVAMATGFRAREVGTLTPRQFDLAGPTPAVWLPVRADKARRAVEQPIPHALVPILHAYLEGRGDHAPDRPVWSAKWSHNGWASAMLQRDCEDAGIPVVVPGRNGPLFADFHSLRHTFVAELDRAGVSLKDAMHLARHSDPRLTMRRYGRPDAPHLAGEVSRIALGGALGGAGGCPMVAPPGDTKGDGARQSDTAGRKRKRPRPGGNAVGEKG